MAVVEIVLLGREHRDCRARLLARVGGLLRRHRRADHRGENHQGLSHTHSFGII